MASIVRLAVVDARGASGPVDDAERLVRDDSLDAVAVLKDQFHIERGTVAVVVAFMLEPHSPSRPSLGYLRAEDIRVSREVREDVVLADSDTV